MFHIVQENCFREANYDNLLKAVKRLNLDYEIIKVKPFTEEIDYKTDRKDVMVWGAVKLARLAYKENWYPGSFLNTNHDFLVYQNKYKDELFNYNSKIIRLREDPLYPDNLPEGFFARPTSDGKLFTGKVFNKEEFEDLRKRLLHNYIPKPPDPNSSIDIMEGIDQEPIQICGIKMIYKEARFWVVKGKVITGSIYKTGLRVYSNPFVDPEAYEYCQRMVDKFQIAQAFVMDLCLGEDGWKILEVGCINSAGFYAADMQKLVISLEENF